MPSKDLLESLFDVEHEAERMVAEAKAEAGRRLDAAKTRARKYYNEAYNSALEKALAARAASDESARNEYEEAVASYRRKLDSCTLDREAFNEVCRQTLGKDS